MKTRQRTKSFPGLIGLIMTFLLLGFPGISNAQTNTKDYAEIIFYRVKQGMMSGGTGMEVKVMMNDREMGAFSNGTKLTCKIYSEGPVKVKCIGTMLGGAIGQPFVTKIDVKHGGAYHIGIQAYSSRGLEGELLDEKQLKKMAKEDWADESVKEEDKSKPIITPGSSANSLEQSDSKSCTEVYFYRVKQGMMSGAVGMEIKVLMNDKEMGTISNNTKLKCKVYSEGPVKIKCVGTMGGGAIGQPFVTNIEAKHGEVHHIGLQASSMKGVTGEILEKDEIGDMEKQEWADESEHKEDISDPLIKK